MIGLLFWLVVLVLLGSALWLWRKERAQEAWIAEQMKRLDWWLREGQGK